MKYTDILNDNNIKLILEDIDNQHSSNFLHGLSHSKKIIDIVLKLSSILNISEEETNYLCIACVLHDIGQSEGTYNHSIRSKDAAYNYLKNKIDNEWLLKILSSIENHHAKENIDSLSLFDHIIRFADTMDITYKRIDLEYLKINSEESIVSNILDVNYSINTNTFIINIITNNKINLNDFNNWDYYSHIVKKIQSFSKKLNLDYKINIINK